MTVPPAAALTIIYLVMNVVLPAKEVLVFRAVHSARRGAFKTRRERSDAALSLYFG